MNNLMKFENQKVEVFEFNGKVLFNPYDVGRCLDLNDSSVRMAIRGMNSKQVILMKNSDVNSVDIRKFNPRGENFLTESGVYKLIFKSRKKEAERFCNWVTDEVLPTIRKTGKYEIESVPTNQPNLPVKYYQGNPVMVIRDLEQIFKLHKEAINWLSVKYNIGTLLDGAELIRFKKENPNVNMKFVSVIRVYKRDDIVKFVCEAGLPYDNILMSEYFDRSSLNYYDRLRLYELAQDIVHVANFRGHNTPYEKMLNLVASKIYIECGFLSEETDDLSPNTLLGWNMQQPIIDFKRKIKKQLTR